MRELLDFLSQNPFLIILLIGFLIQIVGNLGARAARKVAEQQQRQARQAQDARRARQPSTPRPPTPRPPEPARAEPDPDEVAAKIRRMMGMEDAGSPAEHGPRPRPAHTPRPGAGRSAGDRQAIGQARVEAATVEPVRVEIVEMSDEALPAGGAARHPSRRPSHSEAATQRPRRATRSPRTARRLLDLSDPAAAIIAMEVLGPPRALRDD